MPASGQLQQGAETLSLGEAALRLEDFFGYQIEIKPDSATAIRVAYRATAATLDSALEHAFSGLNYSVFRAGKKHYVVHVFGKSKNRDSFPRNLPATKPTHIEEQAPEEKAVSIGPDYVEMTGPDGINELVKLVEPTDKLRLTVEEGWVEQTGPGGEKEWVFHNRPTSSAGP